MAVVKPFRAWHYNSKKVSIERVIAPPYDVILAEEEKIFHARDPHNIIRLILGQSTPARPRPDAAYQDAARFLNEWTHGGVLTQPSREAYYLYEMRYPHPFEKKGLTRLSLFGALKLESFDKKVVFPHEHTHPTAKVDRGKLLRATECNFSPIFILYEDQTKTLDQIYESAGKRPALFDFSARGGSASLFGGQDEKSVGHRLWMIDEPAEVSAIAKTFDQRRVFIADGHHRYETALAYAEEKNKTASGPSATTASLPHAWNYVLSAFVRFHDPGLLILPIHRLISKSVAVQKETLLNGLKQHFVVHPVSRSVLENVSQGKMKNGLGLAFSEAECFLFELKDETTARRAMPAGRPARWYSLEVNLISYLILKPLFKIEDAELEKSVSYTASTEEAFSKLKEASISSAIFVSPTTPETIKDICESGDVMPQKSTYFHPKFPSGLLIYHH